MEDRIEILTYSLPWDAASGRTMREGCLVFCRDSAGGSGVGEAAPLPGWSAESHAECLAALLEHAARRGSGAVPEIDGLPPSARFAIEAAREDAHGWANLPTREPLLPLNALLEGSPEAVLEKAQRVITEGCRTLKIKIRNRSADEIVFLMEEITRMHPGVTLRPDANRSMSPDALLDVWKRVADLPVEYFEEPVSESASLQELIRRHGVPIALDETLREIRPPGLADWKGARALVIKPTLLGGIRECMEWTRMGARLGMASVFSASYESGIGLYAIARMAAAAETPSAAGLDTYSTLLEDTLEKRLCFAGWKIDLRQPRPPLHPRFAGCAA